MLLELKAVIQIRLDTQINLMSKESLYAIGTCIHY